MSARVLEVEGLKTSFFTRGGEVKSVDGVSLTLAPGEVLGLVGESGSGKSVTGFSIMGLIDPPGRVVEGAVRLDGRNLAMLDDAAMARVRGKDLAMIFQDPMMTLNPVLKISTQMIETVQAHDKVSTAEARARSIAALDMVGIPAPDERIDAYPHQFSGGMRQRVAIAIALLHRPKVIIADEPTTALDVTIQSQILAKMQQLCRDTGTALIWITHDLSVVAGLADRVAVMYAGRIVETGPVDIVLDHPRHPYTQGLIGSVPSAVKPGEKLAQIPGSTPSLSALPPGCAFAPRCAKAVAICRQEAPVLEPIGKALVACHVAQATGGLE